MAARGRASAGRFRCRARAGRQSPDGQSRRAREGMRCGTAAKTPDDIRDIPMDEADSTQFRSRAWNGHNRARPSDFGKAGKRAAASESMLGEARAGRTGLVSVRSATRAQPSAILTRCCERPMGAHIAAKPPNKQQHATEDQLPTPIFTPEERLLVYNFPVRTVGPVTSPATHAAGGVTRPTRCCSRSFRCTSSYPLVHSRRSRAARSSVGSSNP